MQAKNVCVSALEKKKKPQWLKLWAVRAVLCPGVSFENMSAVSWTLKWKSIMLAWAAENMETIDHVHCTVN